MRPKLPMGSASREGAPLGVRAAPFPASLTPNQKRGPLEIQMRKRKESSLLKDMQIPAMAGSHLSLVTSAELSSNSQPQGHKRLLTMTRVYTV